MVNFVLKVFDFDFVCSQFLGFFCGWIFFDNVGGLQIFKGVVEWINIFLFEKNVQIGGFYEVLQVVVVVFYEVCMVVMNFVNVQCLEEIVFGNFMMVFLQNFVCVM